MTELVLAHACQLDLAVLAAARTLIEGVFEAELTDPSASTP
jgi:hypothetical protein